MHTESPFILPLTSPTLIFAVVLLVILFSPLLLNRLKVPPLVGLLLSGMALGPFGFNVLSNDDSFHLFGNVGLLYVVFMTGVSIEMNDVRKNIVKGGLFGLYSILIALTLGILSGVYLLHFTLATSILLSFMYASYTLVAYPVVNRFGLGARRSVRIATVGSIVTISASLLVLAFISGHFDLWAGHLEWFVKSIKILLFFGVVLWVFPKIAHSFFKRFEDSILQFILVLSFVYFGAFFAQLAGLESVVGAFMVGVALNRLVPNISPLMNRLEFVGNALFIPFFLIAMGMVINFWILGVGLQAIMVAVVMTTVAILSKWLSGMLARYSFQFNANESRMLFGLSTGKAGITLVILMIGYTIAPAQASHLLPDSVMVGTVIMILITGTVSMHVTENAARGILSVGRSVEDAGLEGRKRERIMFTVANPSTLDHLVELSYSIKQPRSKEDLYALRVVSDNDETLKAQGEVLLQQAAKVASIADQWVERIVRYDVNVANGILYSAKEYAITDIVIGLHQKLKSRDTLLGLMTEMLLKGVSCSLFIYKPSFRLKQAARLVMFLPRKAELEVGFWRCFSHVINLSRRFQLPLMIYATPDTRAVVMHRKSIHQGVALEFFLYHTVEESTFFSEATREDDMCVFFAARTNTISFDEKFDALAADAIQSDRQHNVLVIYPEQYEKPANADDRFIALQQSQYKLEKWNRRIHGLFILSQRFFNKLLTYSFRK